MEQKPYGCHERPVYSFSITGRCVPGMLRRRFACKYVPGRCVRVFIIYTGGGGNYNTSIQLRAVLRCSEVVLVSAVLASVRLSL